MLTLDIALTNVIRIHLGVSTPFVCWTLFFAAWIKYGHSVDARSFSF